jgi:DNA-directed RNA polymerase subunit K/omega
MIDQSKFERLYSMVGGVFKTTVLIQKRLRELNRGARKLVEEDAKNPIETVMREVEERRIELIPDTDENRDLIRAEVERLTAEQGPTVDVDERTTEDELERRILSALSRESE